MTAVRIERMLKRRAEQYTRVAVEDRFGSVTMMDVEIGDKNSLQSIRCERVRRPDRDVVEETESHRAGIRRGPCRHLLALRAVALGQGLVEDKSTTEWYNRLLRLSKN